jgi:hypothetical protein
MCHISLRRLTTADVEDLYPRLRVEDKEECIVLGSTPKEALLMGAFDNLFSGISKGRAYAITDETGIIGAIGFTSSGYLWALSSKFSPSQARSLFKATPDITFRLVFEAIDKGAIQSDGILHNILHAKNTPALKWLRASKCFDVDLEDELAVGAEVFYNFKTKPIEEVLRACASH